MYKSLPNKSNLQSKLKQNKTNGGKQASKKTQNRGNGTERLQRSGITPKVRVPERTWKTRETVNGRIVSGQDFLQTLDFVDNPRNRNTPGAIVFMQYVNPWKMVGTRLHQFANLFQKYKFRKFDVRYVPSVPATVAGQFICAFDTDPTYSPGGGGQAVLRQLTAHRGRRIYHVFDDVTMTLPNVPQKDFFCDEKGSDVRLNLQAVFYAAMLTSVIGQDGAKWVHPVGTFILDWEVEFFNQRIEENSTTSVSEETTYVVLKEPVGRTTIPYSLLYQSGAKQLTKAAAVVIKTYGDALFGVDTGGVYFAGYHVVDDSTEEQVEEVLCLFPNLVSAQRFEVASIIPIHFGVGTDVSMILNTKPLGPQRPQRYSDQLAGAEPVEVALTHAGPGLSFPAEPEFADSKLQAEEYLVVYQGSAPQAQNGVNRVDLFFEDSGDFLVKAGDEMILRQHIDPQAVIAFYGLTLPEFLLIFGFEAGSKRFFGLLLTATGLIIKIVSNIATAVSLALRIKRSIQDTLPQFLTRLTVNNPGFIP